MVCFRLETFLKMPKNVFEGLIIIWQNIEHKVANFKALSNFYCCKWPNIEK